MHATRSKLRARRSQRAGLARLEREAFEAGLAASRTLVIAVRLHAAEMSKRVVR